MLAVVTHRRCLLARHTPVMHRVAGLLAKKQVIGFFGFGARQGFRTILIFSRTNGSTIGFVRVLDGLVGTPAILVRQSGQEQAPSFLVCQASIMMAILPALGALVGEECATRLLRSGAWRREDGARGAEGGAGRAPGGGVAGELLAHQRRGLGGLLADRLDGGAEGLGVDGGQEFPGVEAAEAGAGADVERRSSRRGAAVGVGAIAVRRAARRAELQRALQKAKCDGEEILVGGGDVALGVMIRATRSPPAAPDGGGKLDPA